MDRVSQEKRSQIMSAVRSTDTKAELLVRRYLWSNGIRYRIYSKELPGKPDIVIKRCKLAIFVHGCFWHGHDCPRGRLPKSKVAYWRDKIDANKKRDVRNETMIKNLGWNQYVIWDCQLRNRAKAKVALQKILNVVTYCRDKMK